MGKKNDEKYLRSKTALRNGQRSSDSKTNLSEVQEKTRLPYIMDFDKAYMVQNHLLETPKRLNTIEDMLRMCRRVSTDQGRSDRSDKNHLKGI